MISFKASYISSTNVLQNKISRTKNNREVSFVEMHPANANDLYSLRKASNTWKSWDMNSFSKEILKAFITENKKKPLISNRFFAITTQASNFEKLNPKKILAMCQVAKTSDTTRFVEYLQVDPKNYRKNQDKKFAHVGTAMLNSLKSLYPDKSIHLESVKDAVKFYLKNGFKNSAFDPYNMVWSPNNRSISNLFKEIVTKIKGLFSKTGI